MKSKGISETDFATQVHDLLNLFGWRWCHIRPAWSERGWRTPIQGHDPDGFKGKGLPDIIAVRRGLCIFAELKDDKSELSPEQEAWARDLQAVAAHSLGVCYFVWRPKMIESIVEILR